MAKMKKIPANVKKLMEESFNNGVKYVLEIQLNCLKDKCGGKFKNLANFLGITSAAVSKIFSEGRTQKASLKKLMERIEDGFTLQTLNSIYKPICELEEIEHGCDQITFKKKKGNVIEYLKQLKKATGVYIFYDSVGKAIYAGKAEKQTLFDEMNKVLVRTRANAQSIYHYEHGEMKKMEYYIIDAAHYVSAYDVHPDFISNFEAIFVNAFPNDLTNIRMERHKQIDKLAKNRK